MNELEKYVQFLQDSGETDIKEKVEQWKKDNNWGQEKPENTEFDFSKGFYDFNADLSKNAIDPVVKTETNTGSTNTVSDSESGLLELPKGKLYSIDGVNVTKDKFDAYTKEQENKPLTNESFYKEFNKNLNPQGALLPTVKDRSIINVTQNGKTTSYSAKQIKSLIENKAPGFEGISNVQEYVARFGGKAEIVDQYKDTYTEQLNKYQQEIDVNKEEQDEINSLLGNPELFKPYTVETEIKSGGGGSSMTGYTPATTYIKSETIKPYENQLKEAKATLVKNRKIQNSSEPITQQEIENQAKAIIEYQKQDAIRNDNAAKLLKDGKITETQQREFLGIISEQAKDSSWNLQPQADLVEKKTAKLKNGSTIQNINSFSKSLEEDRLKLSNLKSAMMKISGGDMKMSALDSPERINEFNKAVTEYNSIIFNYDKKSKFLEKLGKDYQVQYNSLEAEQGNLISMALDSDTSKYALNSLKRIYDKEEKLALNLALGTFNIAAQSGVLVEDAIKFFDGTKTFKNKKLFGLAELGVKSQQAQEYVRNKYYEPITFDKAFNSLSNFGNYALEKAVEQAPIYAAIASGGLGMFAVSASSGGDYSSSRRIESKQIGGRAYNPDDVLFRSLGYAGSEYVFGALPTSRLFKSLNKGAGNNTTRELLGGMQQWWNNTKIYAPSSFGIAFIDKIGEGMTQVSQNLFDDSSLNIFRDVPEAVFVGGMFSYSTAATPVIKGAILANFSDFKTYDTYRGNLKMINTLESSLNSPWMDADFKENTKKQIQQLKDQNLEIIETENRKVNNNLSKEGFLYFQNGMERQENLRVEAEAVLANESLSEEQKNKRIKELSNEFQDLKTAINEYKQAFAKTFKLQTTKEQNRLKKEAKTRLQVQGKFAPSTQSVLDEAERIHVEEKINNNISKETSFLESLIGAGVDIKYKAAQTNAEAIKAFTDLINARVEDANNSIDREQGDKYIEQFKEGINSGETNGVNIPSTTNGKKVYDSVVSVQNSIANERSETGFHELGHSIAAEALSTDPNAFKEVAKSILEFLNENNKDAYTRVKARSKGQGFDEVITYFLEEVTSGNVNLEKQRNTGFLGALGQAFGIATGQAGKADFDYNFKGETDVIAFMTQLGTKIKDGTLTVGDVKDIQKSDTLKTESESEVDLDQADQDLFKESRVKLNELAVKSKKEDLSITEQKDLITEYKRLALSGPGLNFQGYKSKQASQQGLKSINKTDAESFVMQYYQGILDRYKPTVDGKNMAFSTLVISNINPKRSLFFEQEIGGSEVETRISDERQKELENVEDTSKGPAVEVDTDVKLVENIKINKQPLSVKFKDKVRGFVTKQLEGLDPKSEKFRKQAFKPSKAFVDLIAKDIIGSPKKFREFLNENPTFYKGLNISELIAIDDGRVKKGQPRLFTEVNRRLTKQSEIEKFMMQGRVPYLTTTQQKAGANLYNRLTPKVAAVINNFFGSTPQNNSNRKRAIAKAIANKFIAEAAPSTEAFKAKPEIVRAKTAEKLQVSPSAKFSENRKNVFIETGLDNKSTPDFAEFNIDYTKTLDSLLKGTGVDRIDMKDEAGRERFLNFAISSGLTKKLPPSFWRKLGFVSENLLKDKTKKYEDSVGETKADIDALIETGAIIDKSQFRGYKGNLPFRSVIEANVWMSESIDAEKARLMKPKDEGGENLSKAKAKIKSKKLFAKDSDFPAMKNMLTYEGVYGKKLRLDKSLNDPEFVKRQDDSIDELGKLFEMFQNEVMRNSNGTMNFEGVAFVGALLSSSSSGQGHFLRSSAPFRFYQEGYIETGASGNTLEHTLPATLVGKYLFMQALEGNVGENFKNIKNNYFQGPISNKNDKKLKGKKLNGEKFDYVDQTPEGWKITDNIWARYFNINVGLNAGGINPSNLILAGGKSVYDVHNITSTGVKVDTKAKFSRSKANKLDVGLVPDIIAYSDPVTTQTLINALIKTDKALNVARSLKAPVKKIRVFDFDDTLATSKSMVIVNMPNGSSKKINATQFAKQAADLEANGAKFDFTEFSKVVKGKKGPLFNVAQKIADVRGTEDVFILTARPQEAAGPIKAFMKANGIDIPLANITGLGDGTAQAKAGWMMGKAAEGYNDFYFADDAIKNVKAVEDVLSQIDVKSKVQQAKFSKSNTFNIIVNDMIEDSSGIETYKKYSAARAKTVGANKGKFNFFIPSSAEDFTGLLYKMLGKGKKGDAQMAFLKTNLLDPYDRAESAVTQAKISAANDFKELKNQLKTLPKSLSKPTGIAGFTFSHAVRVAAWTRQGMSIPGLSKKDIKELNDFVKNNDELNTFTNELIVIQKGKLYPKPGDNWLGGNITSDIINGINKVNRAEYQQEWRENVDIIFSEDNMNKMEAAYGTRWREAMEDSLRRMKSGSNRPPGGNRVTDGLLDWLNNSVGAVMFLNTRSALLQTISSVNFINWGDNNIVKAGLAFANQKQFWSDFMTLMNSDYLVERRNGLKINVSESEIADAVRDSKNKVKSAIAFLLSKGFVMTRFADSFAIATGGSTFYRNRVKALVAKGMDQKAAEKQAFDDFRQIAEESQQSSNPNRISAQQASGAGRVILAWANTPMQYARIQKRAAQDLVNGRGDWKTNVSKIVYYGAVQNLIFNALQQAVFALGFGEDDEETMDAKKSEKISRVANGMIDSQLKGLGIGGAAVVALKTALMELGKQHAKDRSKYEEAVFDLLGFSPPLGSKIQKINSGLRSFSWNMKDIKSKGFSLDNPAYLAGAQIVTGLTNIPLDRVMKKLNSMRGIVNEQSVLWQKVALGLGWSTWDVGLGYYGGFDAAKVLTPEEQAIEDVITMKKETKTQEQVDMLLDLGLTKKEIKALGKEQARVEKIIELQKAEVKPEVKPEAKVEEVKEKPKVKIKPKKETAERKLRRQFDSIKGENKPEQVKTLLDYGLSKKQVRALRYEKDRVEKILELMNK
jgi:hypothetical protein